MPGITPKVSLRRQSARSQASFLQKFENRLGFTWQTGYTTCVSQSLASRLRGVDERLGYALERAKEWGNSRSVPS